MRLEEYRWNPNQTLTRDYLFGFSAVRSLYEYDPWNGESEPARAQWLDQRGRPQADRGKLVDVLKRYNMEIGNAPQALDAVQALENPQTLAVVGGQQAGLFTGPLLVLYKAITLIREAGRASAKLGRRVVPVFWIAGEDHDFDEVNHTYFLSDQLTVEKIKLGPLSDKRASVSRLPVPAEVWEDALNQLDSLLPDTEFKPPLMERIRDICLSSSTLVDQFARIMAWLFGEHGLILVNSDDASLRRLEADMFRELIAHERDISRELLSTQACIKSLGYTPQVEIQEDQANLFIYHEGERLLLIRKGDRFTDKKGKVAFSESELLELALTSPERFSNNVMTRPLMQEYLFPVLLTVLGPAEIAYWGQLRTAFERMGMKMPIVVPRMEFTLLEGTVQKQMNKYGLRFEDVLLQFDRKRQEWLDAQGSLQLADRFAEVKARFADLYKPIVETVAALNPGMRKLGETNMQKIAEQIDFLESRALDAFQSQFESALRHWDRIRLSISPLGKPQERVYNAFLYLNKYGEGWLRDLIDMPLTPNGMHRIVYF